MSWHELTERQQIDLLRFALEMQTVDRHERLGHDGPTFVECSNPVCSNVAWIFRKIEVSQCSPL